MNTIKEKTFRIKKVKKVDGYWELYPKGFDEPLRIKAENVYGKLPPVWKFPWQCHELKLKELVGKFIIYIEMDGCILFNLSEDQYSEKMKQEVQYTQRIEEEWQAHVKEYRASVKAQLLAFLPKVPAVINIEDEISKFPVCWSNYLKMFLPMQYGNKQEQQRLFLLYWLIDIANRLYKRHVDLESSLSIAFASVEFSIKANVSAKLGEAMVQELENTPEFKDKEAFATYFEAKQELQRVLPPVEKRLEIYLNKVVNQLLGAYADDAANLHCKRQRDIWGGTIDTDHEAYRYMVGKMKLPRFSSLIVEKNFSQEEIERINSRY